MRLVPGGVKFQMCRKFIVISLGLSTSVNQQSIRSEAMVGFSRGVWGAKTY
jgi:hypothetical protein